MTIALVIAALFGELTRSVYRIAIVILVLVGVVALVNSCVSNATLSEHSSCQQFNQASASAQDQVLQAMLTAHHSQDGIAAERASLNLYCAFSGDNAPIDGIYGSGKTRQPTRLVLSVPVLRTE